ncbi:MAG TPA: conjugal transfer protein TraF, partial [Vicinamibacterales bacterium]
PVLGAGYYRTRELTGLPTVSASPDRQNGGSGEVPLRTLETTNFGVTVVQTIAPGLVIGTTARLVKGIVDDLNSATTFDLDAGAMMSAWNLRFGVTARNIMEPEFESEDGILRMRRQFRAGVALAPRALPTGVHGPFTVAFDVDLTTTPDVRGERRAAAAGGEYWLAKGLVGVRGGVRWSTTGDSNRALSGGVTVRLPKSLFVEGQMTKDNESDQNEWTAAVRLTF